MTSVDVSLQSLPFQSWTETFTHKSLDHSVKICYQVAFQNVLVPTISTGRDVIVVFAHATGFSKEIWDPLISDIHHALQWSPLSLSHTQSEPKLNRLRVTYVALDAKSHGNSTSGGDDHKIDELLDRNYEDILAVIDDLEIADNKKLNMIGVGHSMAANISYFKKSSVLEKMGRP
eukprot:273913_1